MFMYREKVKELIRLFHEVNYIDLFGALVLNEKLDYLQDLEDITDGDFKYAEELYDYFMDCDSITGLIDIDAIEDYRDYRLNRDED